MNAMKVENDNPKAIALFREAFALNPSHEDSHYYLGLCLASKTSVPIGIGSSALRPQARH
jgi:hypothetical protein